MKKLVSMVVSAVALATVSIAAPLSAVPAGQIEGGNFYRGRNVTKNETTYADPVKAGKCEIVQLRVMVHNPGPDPIENVKVKATMPTGSATSHSSQATVSASNANPTSRTDTVAVTLSESMSLSYVAGSTELVDANGGKISTLPDTLFTSGVDVGTVGVSMQQLRFVRFQVKTPCPETPKECKPGIPVGDARCETPRTPETPKTETPAVLPATGPAAIFGGLFGSSALGLGVHSYMQSRRAVKNAFKQ